jgi:hypothetical protein
MREIAEEAGFHRAAEITFMMIGKAHVQIHDTVRLARALEAPLIPFFRLVMAQFGRTHAEVGDAILESKLIAETGKSPFSGRPKPFTKPSPPIVDMRFEVPMEFRRQFRVEGEARGLNDNELLMLAFRTYASYWDRPASRE